MGKKFQELKQTEINPADNVDSVGYSPKNFNNLVTMWKDGFRCQLILCGNSRENWAFDFENDPHTLYNAIDLFTELTGVRPSIPIRTGRLLLEQSISRKIQSVSDDPETYFKWFLENDEKQLLYLREPNFSERQAKYCHAFDKRAMFLSACAIHLGEGEFEEVDFDSFHYSYDNWKKTQGLIFGDFTWNKDEFNGNKTFLREIFSDGLQPLYTPTARIISEFEGNVISVKKAYVWKNPRKPLEKFYSTLQKSIKFTQDNPAVLHSKLVNKSLKAIYTQFIGWLASSSHSEGKQSNLFRPDWRSLVIAEANARLIRNIFEVYRKTGLLPVGIRYDEILYLTKGKNPDSIFAGTCLLNPSKFSHTFSVPAEIITNKIQAGDGIGKICDSVKRGEK